MKLILDDDALAAVALLLIGEGATAGDLAARFTELAELVEDTRAATLLDRLAALGLVRVATTQGEQPRYVLTSLGRTNVSSRPGGQTALAERLEQLEQLRTTLLSTLAHELRTPLTAVRTSASLLLDPTVRADRAGQEKLLKTIETSADRMQRLVTDLLDLARFRSGHVQLQLRRFDGRALAQSVADATGSLLASKGQELELRLPPGPVWVYGDHRRLEHALLNLLSNAHRFSPEGTIIQLSVQGDEGEIRWSVTDQGPGISEEDRARLFERFFTRAADATGRRAGTGLGLPIALATAQAHGGSVDVDSSPGRGSTFTLRVPRSGPSVDASS